MTIMIVINLDHGFEISHTGTHGTGHFEIKELKIQKTDEHLNFAETRCQHHFAKKHNTV